MTLTTRSPSSPEPVRQFSIFMANKLGRLHDLTQLLLQHQVHILAMTVLDTTDSSILRLVVDDPDRARALFTEQGFPFTEAPILVVEVDAESRLRSVLAALLEAEININYVYAFVALPAGRPLLALSTEDYEIATEALKRHQLAVLTQTDLSR